MKNKAFDSNLDKSLRRVGYVLSMAVLLGCLTGCATWMSGDDEEPQDGEETQVSEYEVDPTLVRANPDGTVDSINAEELFEKAYYDFQARRYEDAAENYQLIIDHFRDSRFFLPALYNGGLAYESLGQWDDAAELFGLVLVEFSESDQALNAHFRLANAHFERKKYQEVQELMTEVLLQEDLEHFDRSEAHVWRGRALLELGEWSDAENSFNNVIRSNQQVTPAEKLNPEHRFMVLSHFGVGRANHGKMNEIPLLLPPERMEQDLEEKADYHQTSQTAYIRALQEHHPHWSVAAGYKIGRLYQDFYMDIFTAEIPDDLNEEELAFYFEELRRKIEILLDRAMSVYERNLSFSRRVAPTDDAEEWVEATALHLNRMRAFLEDPLVQKRAEKLVLEGGDMETLWDPAYYAKSHVGDAVDEALEVSGSEEASDEVARRQ